MFRYNLYGEKGFKRKPTSQQDATQLGLKRVRVEMGQEFPYDVSTQQQLLKYINMVFECNRYPSILSSITHRKDTHEKLNITFNQQEMRELAFISAMAYATYFDLNQIQKNSIYILLEKCIDIVDIDNYTNIHPLIDLGSDSLEIRKKAHELKHFFEYKVFVPAVFATVFFVFLLYIDPKIALLVTMTSALVTLSGYILKMYFEDKAKQYPREDFKTELRYRAKQYLFNYEIPTSGGSAFLDL